MDIIRSRLQRGVTIGIVGLGSQYRVTMDRDGNVHCLRDNTLGSAGSAASEPESWDTPAAAR